MGDGGLADASDKRAAGAILSMLLGAMVSISVAFLLADKFRSCLSWDNGLDRSLLTIFGCYVKIFNLFEISHIHKNSYRFYQLENEQYIYNIPKKVLFQ